MRWEFKDPNRFRRWFAWRPVRIGDYLSRRWVWWEWVDRGRQGVLWEYRLPMITAITDRAKGDK